MIDFAELDRFVSVLERAGVAPAIVPLGTVDGQSKRALVRWRDWPAGTIADLRRPYAVPVEGAGLLTGARSGGIVVIDVDRRAGGPDGFLTLDALERAHGPIPATLTVRSPGGSLHLYLRDPLGRFKTQAGQLGPGLDVRGEGGLVVCPGSWHRGTGGIYRMESG